MTYCQDAVAVPLAATASNSSYTLYYYDAQGALLSGAPTPSTATVGTTTYQVAEGAGNQCISPNKKTVTVTVTAKPVADAGSDRTICTGGSALIGTEAIAGLTYSWASSPAGFTSTTANPTVTPSATTTYTLTVTNASGCKSTDQVTITVVPGSVDVTGCPTDITVCANETKDGVRGSTVDWTLPDFSYSCLSNLSSFYMGFELPEVKWTCWDFNQVQRVGNNSGVLNLAQSVGDNTYGSGIYIVTPTVYIKPALTVYTDFIVPAGMNFTWSVYLIQGATQTLAGSTTVTTSGQYQVNIPNTFTKGEY